MSNSNKKNESNQSSFKVRGDIEVLQGSFTSRSFKAHFHDSYTLILVESGTADYSYKKNEMVVSPNRLLVLNPYEVHTGKQLGEGIWNFRSMYIPQSVVKENFDTESDQLPIFGRRYIDDIPFLSRYQLLHEQLMTKEISINEESQLSLLLQELTELAGLELINDESDTYSSVCGRMRDYIHEYYMENIQLDDLMSVSGLSKFHMIKVYREKYGLPPHQYLNNLRIERAKKLLAQGMSATDVTHSVGFFDQSHFIKHFKAMVGVTPSQYAKRK